MGLAASQARLLTITARLADNELRSQTINNAKMRLATQSAQASNEYVSALNNAQLMFNNTAENGIAQSQTLTFNALTQYSQYNNQYGLVNSAGQILVSEADAKMFQDNPNNLEGFLKAHGLEWDTTYFNMTDTDGSQINLVQRLTDFYTGSYEFIGDLFNGMTNEQLKTMYLDSISQEASIEQLNYNVLATNYYRTYQDVRDNLYVQLRNEIFGTSTSDDTEQKVIQKLIDLAVDDSGNYKIGGVAAFKAGIENGTKNLTIAKYEGKDRFSLDSLKEQGLLTNSTIIMMHNLLSGLVENGSNVQFQSGTFSFEQQSYSAPPIQCQKVNDDGTVVNDSASNPPVGNTKKYVFDAFTIYTDVYEPETKTKTINIYDEDHNVTGTKDVEYQWFNGPKTTIVANAAGYKYGTTDISADPNNPTVITRPDLTNVDGIRRFIQNISNSAGNLKYGYESIWSLNEDNSINDSDYKIIKTLTSSDVKTLFEDIATSYFDVLFNNASAIDLQQFANTRDSYSNLAGDFDLYFHSTQRLTMPKDAQYLLDYDLLIKDKGLTYNGVNAKMKSVLGVYMTEKMVDVLGEPKYAWIDKSANPTDNPDNKAQWLTNLFNRMQKGYKVLENGLASSSQWLEYAFESGLVTMEQVDMSYNWINMDYKTCSNIYEQTDNSAIVAKAEAKYNRAMNDIKQKDSLFDLQLKNIDTEHSALQTEYDVIKGVMSKNIERTMKFDQSA